MDKMEELLKRALDAVNEDANAKTLNILVFTRMTKSVIDSTPSLSNIEVEAMVATAEIVGACYGVS